MNPTANEPTDDLYEFDASGALLKTHLPLPRRSGKVRDVYDLGDALMIVSSDRISAFDFILPSGIPGKGRLLTQMSRFWFSRLDVRHHLRSSDVPVRVSNQFDTAPLEGRIMIVEKAKVVPFECVVRGYLEGSGLREYEASGEVCGNKLPPGLRQCDRLPEAIFTPATKAEEGHDENVSIGRMIADVGSDLALELRRKSLEIYEQASQYAATRGLLIADTKFEFGIVNDELVLVDEVLTPDSSRFWDAASYSPGAAQPSFDKQFVREYLSTCGWDKQSNPPPLPPEVIEQTAAKYHEAFQRITGESLL
ncbi:phosphoribosylaminoimidazolesuccinocarboxamide synthase [Novipirellula artificiosorum]|uniref:Phosphoribosylaminoimidazole-succinocarboxamide synthase n=1 Tax=Novipirellula artificiosorum TaxID=2528016 RepID=A0A5C6E5W6_9BACT|nr:phosphoribosylaminoimidazolesuccinocarboxamide synthase [Novipirellula artificiosorum]TWU42876.1 Phosphoribosylaminoimidazole-succinocarboxamide synthase [Novipirellula artificiosorum]